MIKINIEELYNRMIFGGRGLEYKKIHISVPQDLIKLLEEKHPKGNKSRIISLALAEKLKNEEKREYDNLRKTFHSNLIKNTDWQGVYKSFENYPK